MPPSRSEAETCVDKGAAGKLWDGSPWHRPVMDKSRAFSIERPWYSILAAGHVPEMVQATLRDAFGLRGRLTVCVPQPRFQRLSDVLDACAELSARSHAPEDFFAALLYPVLDDSLRFPDGGSDTQSCALRETSLSQLRLRAFARVVLSLCALTPSLFLAPLRRVPRAHLPSAAFRSFAFLSTRLLSGKNLFRDVRACCRPSECCSFLPPCRGRSFRPDPHDGAFDTVQDLFDVLAPASLFFVRLRHICPYSKRPISVMVSTRLPSTMGSSGRSTTDWRPVSMCSPRCVLDSCSKSLTMALTWKVFWHALGP